MLDKYEESDRERILSALELAKESALVHSMGAAEILAELGLDADTIIASLIYPLPASQSGQFDPAVALLVQEIEKVSRLKTNNSTIHEAENIRNMLFALTDDIRVIFIRLAEKLFALRSLDSSGEKPKALARECLDIYAPLAGRLGISWLKNELEDLSLKFLNPETYQQIKSIVAEKRKQRNESLELAQQTILSAAKAAGINVRVESRAKHFYSVYMKMRKRGVSAEKIYDLSGIRIICDSVENCYTLLGIAHQIWMPLSGCFKDYIARPKPNGYQSLHTTVIFDEDGRHLEIQIRTAMMQQIAEYGVASHWLYKKGSSRDMVNAEDIAVANKLKDWKQGPGESSPSWLNSIKEEILKNRIYVFTPQGKVIKLPAGATPIDFAYQIHTAIGDHCVGAKANGSIVPLNSQLKNTQVVEILTSPSAHPNLNWLESVKSPKARHKIRSWLEKNDAFFNIERPAEKKKKAAGDAPAVSAGPDRKSPVQMLIHPLSSSLKVRIEDEKNMMIRFARCCNPSTDDSITGYISRGRGIIIHCINCRNLANNPELENRKIEAAWDDTEAEPLKRTAIRFKKGSDRKLKNPRPDIH
ncbi:MAG: HD domain-containing protein [Treponema sp.]|nr:HD domain-containing protein [Treponema sp.]